MTGKRGEMENGESSTAKEGMRTEAETEMKIKIPTQLTGVNITLTLDRGV